MRTICEAAQRPTMRFVAVKECRGTGECAGVSHARPAGAPAYPDNQCVAGPLDGIWLGRRSGSSPCGRTDRVIKEPRCELPQEARSILHVLIALLKDLGEKITMLDREIAKRANEDPVARRLMSIPGIGPIIATAIAALAPPVETFKRGRDFAAWVGLTPLQRSTGGKQKLGATSKMGERTIRRLLIIGASAVVSQAVRRGAPQGSWLARMLARKPRMLVSVALANKMARIAWALLVKDEVFKAPVVVMA